jgi:hypothetical protein
LNETPLFTTTQQIESIELGRKVDEFKRLVDGTSSARKKDSIRNGSDEFLHRSVGTHEKGSSCQQQQQQQQQQHY